MITAMKIVVAWDGVTVCPWAAELEGAAVVDLAGDEVPADLLR